MIIMKNGKKLSSIVISTALGHSCSGLFPYTLSEQHRRLKEIVIQTNTAVFSKSSTPQNHKGRVILFESDKPWTLLSFLFTASKYIKKLSDKEMLNSFGLTNKGTKVHSEEIAKASLKGIRAIPNVFLFLGQKSIEQLILEAIQAVGYIAYLPLYFTAVELNWSCPNSGEDMHAHYEKIIQIRRAVKKAYPFITIIDKMGPAHPLEFLQEMERDGDTIFHLFNTIPFEEVFPGKTSPILNVPGGGGYSGTHSKPIVFPLLEKAGKTLKSAIIMGHGVDCDDDIKKLFGFGAGAVSTCKMVLQDTKNTIKILEKYNT